MRTVFLPFQVIDRIWFLVVVELNPSVPAGCQVRTVPSFQRPPTLPGSCLPSSVPHLESQQLWGPFLLHCKSLLPFLLIYLSHAKKVPSFRNSDDQIRPTQIIQDHLPITMFLTLITSAKSLLHYKVTFSQVLRTCDVSQNISGHVLIWLLQF